MFDCVLPTRSARTGSALTWRGRINMIGGVAACGLGLSLVGLVPIVGIFVTRWSLRTRWGISLATALVLATMSLAIPASGVLGLDLELLAVVGFYVVVFWYVVTVCGGLTIVERKRQFEPGP